MIAEAAGLHATHSVEGNEALSQTLGLVVPALASVNIVREICGESVGDLRLTVRVTGNGLVADVGVRDLEVLCDFKGVERCKEKD